MAKELGKPRCASASSGWANMHLCRLRKWSSLRLAAFEVRRVVHRELERNTQILQLGHWHVQLAHEIFDTGDAVGVLVRGGDAESELLLVRLHAVPKRGEERVRVVHHLGLEGRFAALQVVFDALAPLIEWHTCAGLQVHLVGRVDPRVCVERAHRKEGDMDELPTVDGGLPTDMNSPPSLGPRTSPPPFTLLVHLLMATHH